MPDFTVLQWTLVLIAAFCSGVSKAGLAGMGLLGVTFMAAAVPGRASSGIVLPLLIFADVIAASTFREHVQWSQIRRLAWPVGLGIVVGWVPVVTCGTPTSVNAPPGTVGSNG